MTETELRLRQWIEHFGNNSQPPFLRDLKDLCADNASLRSQLATVTAERDRLREACQLAADELTHATWAKGADQRGLKYAIKKCEAALSTTEVSQP